MSWLRRRWSRWLFIRDQRMLERRWLEKATAEEIMAERNNRRVAMMRWQDAMRRSRRP